MSTKQIDHCHAKIHDNALSIRMPNFAQTVLGVYVLYYIIYLLRVRRKAIVHLNEGHKCMYMNAVRGIWEISVFIMVFVRLFVILYYGGLQNLYFLKFDAR